MAQLNPLQLLLLLTAPEIRELTEYARPAQQRRRLDEMGIPYIVGRTGSPLVFRAALENWMLPGSTRSKRSEPDFSALSEI